MEKILNPYDMEYMKMAMLKHEETFKQQLYELHRLYKTQKTLMKSMRKQRRAIRGSGGVEEENEQLELTLGPSCYRRRSRTTAAASFDPTFSSTEELIKWGVDEFPEGLNPGSHGGGPNRPNVVEDVQQFRLNNSPWHFQALSLNMTS